MDIIYCYGAQKLACGQEAERFYRVPAVNKFGENFLIYRALCPGHSIVANYATSDKQISREEYLVGQVMDS